MLQLALYHNAFKAAVPVALWASLLFDYPQTFHDTKNLGITIIAISQIGYCWTVSNLNFEAAWWGMSRDFDICPAWESGQWSLLQGSSRPPNWNNSKVMVATFLGDGKVNPPPSPKLWCQDWAHHVVPGQGRGWDSNSSQDGNTKGVGWQHQRQHGANIAKKPAATPDRYGTVGIMHIWSMLQLWYYVAESCLQGFLLKKLAKRNSHWCFFLVKMQDKKVLVKQWGGSDF